LLYDSLHKKLLTLPDHVLVYPAHGAGSLCGRNMRAERSSTIGTERLTNYALQIKSRDEFIRQLTSNLPSRPDYFLQDAEMNRSGATALSDLPALQPVSPAEVMNLMTEGVPSLDVRPADEFATAHVPGSIHIALSGQFASWAGTLLGLSSRPILIAASPEQVAEAHMRLARVGIEDLRGYLDGGIDAWKKADLAIAHIPQITADSLAARLNGHKTAVLDVRREPEWQAGHIEGATWWPLDHFKVSAPEIDHTAPITVHCKSGYRSMIACSLLQRAGFSNVSNVIGGFDAWLEAKLPIETGSPVGV
jgi:hydroxyacylglutathione hydrolase